MSTRSALWRSRRAILLTTLLAASVLLTNTEPSFQSRLRLAALDLAAPVANLFARAASAARHTLSPGNRADDPDSLERLRERNAELEDQIRRLTDLASDAQKTLLAVPDGFLAEAAPILQFVSAEAEILTYDPGISNSSAVILGGRASALRPGLGVVRHRQVVGKVVDVGEHSSVVRFLIDPGFRMLARVARTGEMGLLVGTGAGCELRYVPFDADLREGDAVVSTGNDDAFPPGLYIGDVGGMPRRTAFLEVPVRCPVRPWDLETVFILHKESAHPGGDH